MKDFLEEIKRKTDAELYDMLAKPEDWLPESFAVAKEELTKRNPTPERLAQLEAKVQSHKPAAEAKAQERPENSRSKITCRYCGGEDGEHAASCQEHGTCALKEPESLVAARSFSFTQPASPQAQTVGMICAIVNLVTFFALPVFQFSILKFTMYDLADKVGGATLSLWLVPIVAGVYLFFFFQNRTAITTLFVKSIGGSLLIAVLLMLFRVILFSKDIIATDTHGTVDFKEAFSRFSIFDVLGLGFYTSVIASATALIYSPRSTPDQLPLNQPPSNPQQAPPPIVSPLNTGVGILTLEEVAHRLKVTVPAATTLVESGALRAKKIGDQWRVSEAALTAFINN